MALVTPESHTPVPRKRVKKESPIKKEIKLEIKEEPVIEPDIKDNNNNRAGDDEFDWPEGETIFPGVPDTTPAPPILLLGHS